jgi:hypothetical protein
MTMGDIEWQIEDQINPHVYQEENPALLEILTPELVASWTKDTLVIIDPLILAYYNHQNGEIITDGIVLILQ